MDKEIALNSEDNCLIELEVYFKLDTGYNLFSLLNEDLKSRVIIHFHSFNLNTDQDGAKYILKGKAYNQQEILTPFINNFEGDYLNLSDNLLGSN